MLIIKGFLSYPSPRARMWDSSSEGIKTLRNSAEKMPPFFMAPVFLMLSVTERRGWRKWNSLKNNKHLIRVNILQLDVYLMQKGKLRLVKASHIIRGYKVLNLEKWLHFFIIFSQLTPQTLFYSRLQGTNVWTCRWKLCCCSVVGNWHLNTHVSAAAFYINKMQFLQLRQAGTLRN